MKDREFEQQMEDHKTQSKQPKLLDKKGFVFLDATNYPFWCCLWEEEPWLFRWHISGSWISYRKLNQTEIWYYNNMAIPDEQAEVYHQLHRKNLPSIYN